MILKQWQKRVTLPGGTRAVMSIDFDTAPGHVTPWVVTIYTWDGNFVWSRRMVGEPRSHRQLSELKKAAADALGEVSCST